MAPSVGSIGYDTLQCAAVQISHKLIVFYKFIYFL